MERDLESGWGPWPVWSAVWVGALSALAVGLIIGLIGYAIELLMRWLERRLIPWRGKG